MPEPAGEPRHRHPVRAIAMSSTPFHAFAAGGPMQARVATGTLRAAAADALDAVVTLLPRLLGFLLVLALGWLFSSLVGRGGGVVSWPGGGGGGGGGRGGGGPPPAPRRSGVTAFGERLGVRSDPAA